MNSDRLSCDSAGEESACNAGDLGSILGLGRFPLRREGYPLQYPGLENSMDCIVYGVAKSQTQLSVHACTNTRILGILAPLESASLVSCQKFFPAGILAIFI